MPVFEFRCKKCKAQFSELCGRDDPRETKCPKCKKGIAVRLLSPGKFRIETQFEPGLHEDFAEKPVKFESKAEMEKYCRDNNLGLKKIKNRLQ